MSMQDRKEYLWLVKTNKGDFFITVIGDWTLEEAAKKLVATFEKIELEMTAMIPRKRAPGLGDAQATIYQREESEDGQGFEFIAGKKLWEACGRGVEFEAETIRLKKEG